MISELHELKKQIGEVRSRIDDMSYNTGKIVRSEFKKNWRTLIQAPTYFGLYLALCVDTNDPIQQNRIRFFSPALNHPDTPLDHLNWAWPISPFGGFDDCGVTWVPPAGSTVCIIFDRGQRNAAFYLGTTWSRNRGPLEAHNFNYDMREYYQLHAGHRRGYIVGKNDESQSLPPWNTENYNTFDYNSPVTFEQDPEHIKHRTYPHIYGFKTPQKHMLKMVDGNYKCNHRWKRFELLSSCGNFMIFKDDHLHPAVQCINPGAEQPADRCHDEEGNPLVDPEDCEVERDPENEPLNIYFKHENEMRPYVGPQTPQNNRVELEQSGIQLLSRSGHTFAFDDSVEQPRYSPEWELSARPFDFGCTDRFTGKTFWKSATGHLIEMSDYEEEEKIRGDENYIRLRSACGNLIELNDHTTAEELAGERRGITLRSTSNHSIEMIDNENEQSAPERRDGGQPEPKAKRAFVRIRSGYGLEIALNDYLPGEEEGAPGSQEETINQHIQIFCPQKDNEERGPHIMRFQEKEEGPGQVWLHAGGDYVCTTHDNHVTVVGDIDENPSNKITVSSQHNVVSTENMYYNVAEKHAFYAKDFILLMVGEECKPIEGDECQPCVWPVLCLSPKGITISDKVFVSASPDAQCANILHLMPFHSCTPWEHCDLGETIE